MIDASSAAALVLSRVTGHQEDNVLVWCAIFLFLLAGVYIAFTEARRVPLVLLSAGMACWALADAHPLFVG